MHAESREFIGETYSNAPIVTGTPPISPSAPLVSTDIKEAGLWLWQGEAPPLPAPPRPKSRGQGYLCRIPAAGWVGWIAVPAGLALALLAVSMTPRPDRSVSVDTPGSARSSVPSPAVTRPIDPVPSAERTEAQVDQAQVPSVPPAAKLMAQGPEPPVMKGRAQHKLSRTRRKTHASHVGERPLFPRPGVLTPPPRHGMVVVTDRQWRTSDCPDTYGGTSANIASAPALAIGDTAIGKAVEMLGFAPPAPISAASTTTAPGRFESPARSSLGNSLAGHHHSCSTRVSVTVASASLSQGPVLG